MGGIISWTIGGFPVNNATHRTAIQPSDSLMNTPTLWVANIAYGDDQSFRVANWWIFSTRVWNSPYILYGQLPNFYPSPCMWRHHASWPLQRANSFSPNDELLQKMALVYKSIKRAPTHSKLTRIGILDTHLHKEYCFVLISGYHIGSNDWNCQYTPESWPFQALPHVRWEEPETKATRELD